MLGARPGYPQCMRRRELGSVSVVVVGALALCLGGVFYSQRFDGAAILRQEATYAASIVNGRHPVVLSFYSGGVLVRRKVADPGRKLLAVYDGSGRLLRWEHGDVFYIRAASGFCFERMTGQDYVGRLYLPSLPLRGARDVRVSQRGDGMSISWLSPTADPGRWRTNKLSANYSTLRLYWYRFSGASRALSYPTGRYVFSYPRRVSLARAPSPDQVCSAATQRISG
jgi:hypothetical protein